MSKSYEQYAKQIEGFTSVFRSEMEKTAEEITKVLQNPYYSDFAKQEKKKQALERLEATSKKLSEAARQAVKRFSGEHRLVMPKDGKDHSIDLENAIKVIDMLGSSMDIENFENIIKPMAGDLQSVKTVIDLMSAKDKESDFTGYSSGVMSKIIDYKEVLSRAADYSERLSALEGSLDGEAGGAYQFTASSNLNATRFEVSDMTPYNLLSCPGWIREAGQQNETVNSMIRGAFGGIGQPESGS